MAGPHTPAPLPSRAQLEVALQQALASRSAAAQPVELESQRIVAVYLFGSFARGSARAGSDVDLGLLYAEAPGPRLEDQPFSLEADLSEALCCKVQCIVMNRAPADLVHRILRDRQLLIDRAPGLRIRFEVAARNRYFDVRPLQERYRRGGHAA